MPPLLDATLLPALLADDAPPKRRSLAPIVGWESFFQGVSFEEKKSLLRSQAKMVEDATSLEDVKDALETFFQMYGASDVHKMGFSTRKFIVPTSSAFLSSSQCPSFGHDRGRRRFYHYDNKPWQVWSYDDDRALLVRKLPDTEKYELIIVQHTELT